MRTTNLFILRGYVGNAPKQFNKVTKVSVATRRLGQRDQVSGKREEHTDWVEVTILNEKTAEWVFKNVKSGDPIYAECRVRSGSYKDKNTGEMVYSTDVIANLFDLLAPSAKDDSDRYDDRD